jgi:hypothetical protein
VPTESLKSNSSRLINPFLLDTTTHRNDLGGPASINHRKMENLHRKDTAMSEGHVENTVEMSAQKNLSSNPQMSANINEQNTLRAPRDNEFDLFPVVDSVETSRKGHDILPTKSLTQNNTEFTTKAATKTDFNQDAVDSIDFLPPSPRLAIKTSPSITEIDHDKQAKLGDWRVNRSNLLDKIENDGISPAINGAPPAISSGFNAEEISKKIEAMVAATKALKPDAPEPQRPGSTLPAKMRRLKEGNVLMKIKTAMNYHLHSRTNKKPREPTKAAADDGAILHSAFTSMDLRMNEGQSLIQRILYHTNTLVPGDNLLRPKIGILTGHGKIPRKPLADDGMLLRSHQSAYNLHSQVPLVSDDARTPPCLDHQHGQNTPDSTGDLSRDMQGNSEELPLLENTTEPLPSYDTDIDAPFSSSPLAQSTPRIRLVAPRENGRVASDFDNDYSDMDLGITRRDSIGIVPRDTPEPNETGLSVRLRRFTNRMKKHPSPSKAQLEKWGVAMGELIGSSEPRNFGQADEEAGSNVDSRPVSSILAPKSTNANLQEQIKEPDTGKGAAILQTSDMATASTSMDTTSGRNKGRKSISRPRSMTKIRSREAPRRGRSFSTADLSKDDLMDIDELQLEQPPLMKKA